jgi:2-polyprenyl-3-methyl-5-hydroxy-6-metoxy-1,4-benzoquinol methylase
MDYDARSPASGRLSSSPASLRYRELTDAVQIRARDAAPRCFCGSTHYRSVLQGTYDRLLLTDYAFAIVVCVECGLARTLPVPDPEQYARGYALTTAADGRFVGATDDAWSASIVEDVRSFVPVGRLLDIGCHVGNLVAAATARGYDAVGIDLDPVATAEARRLGRAVRTAGIEDVEETFDVVVMNQLLEHVFDLREFLAHVARVVEPGGYALVYVPCYRGLMPRLMRTHWMGWFPSQHVWHFAPETLRRVVEEATPLRLVRRTTKGVIEPPSTGTKGWAKARIIAFSRAVGWGDEIEAVFRKPERAPHA